MYYKQALTILWPQPLIDTIFLTSHDWKTPPRLGHEILSDPKDVYSWKFKLYTCISIPDRLVI